MLKAKLDAVRKNKKGFSLVELIIVMAIMVALIAVLAPQFVKYVQRARDSSVTDAADNVFAVVKSEYALGNLHVATPTSGTAMATIVVCADKGKDVIKLNYDDTNKFDVNSVAADTWGIDSAKKVNSSIAYMIKVTVDTKGMPSFSMVEGTVAGDNNTFTAKTAA